MSKINEGTLSSLSSRLNNKSRSFSVEDIPNMLDKIFKEFDQDNNHRFTKLEFPKVVESIISLVGGETPTADDVEDLFNLLDVNGDETIDRQEFTSLLTTFFKILKEERVNIEVSNESDIVL